MWITWAPGQPGRQEGISGSNLWVCVLQHSVQLFTISSSCLESPGHHMDCLARSRHFVIPWCPVCILSSISSQSAAGITTLLPRMSIPFSTDSSAARG